MPRGDRVCSETLDLYERAMRESRGGPGADPRWRLEHYAMIPNIDFARPRDIGMSPSFYVNYVLHYGPELRDSILGPERRE